MNEDKRSNPRLLKAAEVADRLRVAERTVWTLVASGNLVPIRLGKRTTRFDSVDVERLIEKARRGAARR